MGKKFSAAVSDWVRKSEAIADVVVKTSVQRLAERANLDGPSVGRGASAGKGGRMPRVTGFLKNTMRAEIGSLPVGPKQNAEKKVFDDDEWSRGVSLVIDQMKPGDVIYVGWSAVYARKMELKYAFMKGAAMEWQGIVNDVVAEARARIGG
ncbi:MULTISPECIES: hypothetical protein [Hyphobacterium]|uniref:HK97 gp10 family phage protein n=1 Tax=Hyphobacterium vulgare TaxID=1736751 RepID=A0ABV6ZUB9_9PROT